jgi:hypothetical protein
MNSKERTCTVFLETVDHGYIEITLSYPEDIETVIAKAVFSPERALAFAYGIEAMVKQYDSQNPPT